MNFTSYVGKVFVVESSKAIIRDEQLRELRYKSGEELPSGKKIGDVKTIPQRTEVRVLDVKVDSDRHTYVLAAANDTGKLFGWTTAMNLEGGFKNETAGLAPAMWDFATARYEHDLRRRKGIHSRETAQFHVERNDDSDQVVCCRY